MGKQYEIFIDRQSGTWGIARDLVIATVDEATVDSMEEMSDSQLIQMAYRLEDEQR